MLRLTLLMCIFTATATAAPSWYGFGGNAQHAAQASAPAQSLSTFLWKTSVDLHPQHIAHGLAAHYGSPLITGDDLILVPLKTTRAGNFMLQNFTASGHLLWQMPSDWLQPPSLETISFPAQLTKQGLVYAAGAGGTVLVRRANADPNLKPKRLAFYDIEVFRKNRAVMEQTVMIATPITADSAGNIYFGFFVAGSNPAHLVSGIARIGADGSGKWVSAAAAARNPLVTQPQFESAPAISNDGNTVYIGVTNTLNGYVVGIDTATMRAKYRVLPRDPQTRQPSYMVPGSTSSATIGPDGDVYFGVLENPLGTHNARGWLLHYDATLTQEKTPGSFGWDDTASIVPRTTLPTVPASGNYFLSTKYNNYYGIGTGDGENKLAVLDPHATQRDEYSQKPILVMKEVETILDPTPNPNGGVYEWCVNSAAVDTASGAIFSANEDGNLYRWDLATNTLSQQLRLNPPLPQSYTPSIVGPNGIIYAIDSATLYAAGSK